MKQLDIKPPYILMPHSISGLYSLYYANQYPEEVEAIIVINCSMPKQFDNTPIPAISDSAQSMYHFMDKSGITRLTIYLPIMTYLGMVQKSDAYSKEEVRALRAMYSKHCMTKAMINESNKILENSKVTYDLVFLETVSVLILLRM